MAKNTRAPRRRQALGDSASEREHEFQQASTDGRRILLKAAAQARRGECAQAISNLAVGANRIGSALAHSIGLRSYPEPQKSLLTAQRSGAEIVTRFCKPAPCPPAALSGAARRRRSR